MFDSLTKKPWSEIVSQLPDIFPIYVLLPIHFVCDFHNYWCFPRIYIYQGWRSASVVHDVWLTVFSELTLGWGVPWYHTLGGNTEIFHLYCNTSVYMTDCLSKASILIPYVLACYILTCTRILVIHCYSNIYFMYINLIYTCSCTYHTQKQIYMYMQCTYTYMYTHIYTCII